MVDRITERTLERRFRTASADATEAFGEALGRRLDAGHVLALTGEMGAGKTTLVRGLARGLDVPADAVSSPTFALMNEYEGRVPVRHFDAWMTGREAVFLEGGGAELLGGGAASVVEWADRVGPWLPADVLWLEIGLLGLQERLFTLWTGPEALRSSSLLEAFEAPREIEER